jgi:hypothetical protein
MSSGSWLALHNGEIYYLSAVNCDLQNIDIIFIRVSFCPRPERLIFDPSILSWSLFTLQPYPTIIAEVTIYPARFAALFWIVSGPLFT